MPEIAGPPPLDAFFAEVLTAKKRDFVDDLPADTQVVQHGAALVDSTGFPGWVSDLSCAQPVIETYVASRSGVTATSDNQRFVDAWLPLVTWLDDRVRSALDHYSIDLVGDAYVTASTTAVASLEGVAHMDDDTYVPDEAVQVVAIVGQWQGPRVATAPLTPQRLRAMGQVVFDPGTLADLEAGRADHHACPADQIVICPQFGQLHAGPRADALVDDHGCRQLLVYRGRATAQS